MLYYELSARFDSRKSFYGKAHIKETPKIKLALQFLTDEELKALAAVAITRETADGTPLKNL